MKYYNVKVKFFSEELNKAGEPKSTITQYLVQDETIDAATHKANAYLADSAMAYEIANVNETKIEAVIK